ncbi:hypothetical protein EFW17_22800 [Halostreptopolyspora alba]|uniref:Uncharacterized protein n=1 Tax=Halostreptopolyspora alba TaxID=2487137 RepID=A0A3N0DYF8_9ACTN|nr:hypothetical protein EFW17_22800 [Nocardiopsaceae bacterium YIM 96095]
MFPVSGSPASGETLCSISARFHTRARPLSSSSRSTATSAPPSAVNVTGSGADEDLDGAHALTRTRPRPWSWGGRVRRVPNDGEPAAGFVSRADS